MILRTYKPEDAEELATVYRESVRGLGVPAYSPQQVQVWAMHPEDMETFRHALAEGTTLVAEADGAVVAFGQRSPPDHIAYLYCLPAYARKGYASAIYERLETAARQAGVPTLHTEASRVARSFFEKKGFHVVTSERVRRQGTEFERFRMEKNLAN